MNIDFAPHTMKTTIVYNADGVEIDRLEGHVTISGKDYDAVLPITFQHVFTTTEIVSQGTITKK